MRPNPFGKDN